MLFSPCAVGPIPSNRRMEMDRNCHSKIAHFSEDLPKLFADYFRIADED